jgi:hypothetical protein
MKSIARITVAIAHSFGKRTALVLSLISLVFVTGCAGGGSGGASPVDYTSAKQVATALKCTNYAGGYGEEGATDSGACLYSGDQVVVAWFKSAKSAKAYYEQHHIVFDASFGNSYLFGTNWAVECPSYTGCSSARHVLGGKLVGSRKSS